MNREVIEIDAWNGSSVVTLRYTTAPGFTTGAGDTPPSTLIPGKVIDPGLIKFTMFSGNKTYGQSSYAFGEVVLNNADRSLDSLKTYSFDGRELRCYEGSDPAAFPAGYTRTYTAIIGGLPSFEWDQVSFSIRNKQANLDVPVPAGMFQGNNSGSAGIEGGADLKGQYKPFLLGRAFNISPVCCNTSKLIYAVSPATGISAVYMGSMLVVYDSGAELLYEGTYTSQADMEANAPAPGKYRVWEQGGYIRLGSTPAGAVTCDAASYGRSVTAKVGNLMADLLTLAGVPYDSSSISQLNTDFVAETGIFTKGGSITDCLDLLAASAGSYWYFSSTGVFKVGRLLNPSGLSADYTLSTVGTAIHSASVAKSEDTPGGIPSYAVTLLRSKNNTVMTDVAGRVSAERKAWLASEWRKTQVVDTAVQTAHPLSQELEIATALTQDNATEATRRAGLYSVQRDLLELELSYDAFGSIANVRPGLCVAVDLEDATQGSTLHRFNYINKKMILIGYTINRTAKEQAGRITATFWG